MRPMPTNMRHRGHTLRHLAFNDRRGYFNISTLNIYDRQMYGFSDNSQTSYDTYNATLTLMVLKSECRTVVTLKKQLTLNKM